MKQSLLCLGLIAAGCTLATVTSDAAPFTSHNRTIIKASDVAVTRQYDNLREFSGIETNVSVAIEYFVVSDNYHAEVTLPDNFADKLECEVRGGDLKIQLRFNKGEGCDTNGKEIIAKVYGPAELTSINVSTSSSFTTKDTITSPGTLQLDATTSGSINLNKVETPRLKVAATTSGNVNISRLDTQFTGIKADTSAHIALGNVTTADFDADASTAATVKCDKVDASEATLSASLSSLIEVSSITAKSIESSASLSATINLLSGMGDYHKQSTNLGGKINVTGFTCNKTETKTED